MQRVLSLLTHVAWEESHPSRVCGAYLRRVGSRPLGWPTDRLSSPICLLFPSFVCHSFPSSSSQASSSPPQSRRWPPIDSASPTRSSSRSLRAGCAFDTGVVSRTAACAELAFGRNANLKGSLNATPCHALRNEAIYTIASSSIRGWCHR